MLIRRGFTFELKVNHKQSAKMAQFAGCCRLVYNKALDLEKETGYRNYYQNANDLVGWKKEAATQFLAEAPSQCLQQSLMDLERAHKNNFEGRAGPPKFKKKFQHDSFRYPQGFKVDEANNRIYLPKIGWIKYRNSRPIEGKPKQVTVSRVIDKWSVSIQTEIKIASTSSQKFF